MLMNCGMQCGSFMGVSIIIVFKWPNKSRCKAPPPPYIFSLRMKFIIVMIKKLVQQLPSAALAQKKKRLATK